MSPDTGAGPGLQRAAEIALTCLRTWADKEVKTGWGCETEGKWGQHKQGPEVSPGWKEEQGQRRAVAREWDVAAEISGAGKALWAWVPARWCHCQILALLLMTCETLERSHALHAMPFLQCKKDLGPPSERTHVEGTLRTVPGMRQAHHKY